MKITDEQRRAVFQKYCGRCAYCGCKLKKGWHIDHIEAVDRTRSGKMRIPQNDVIENYNPSCPECNRLKGLSSVRQLRDAITVFAKNNPTHETSMKFVVNDEMGSHVAFYFERNKQFEK